MTYFSGPLGAFDKNVEDGVTAATVEASEHLVYVTGAELSLE